MSGTTPAMVVNRALDLLGRSDIVIGDLEEGTEGAKPALRAYGPALRQLLRSAPWAFARKQAPLTLLADATGQTPNVGTKVQAPWTYEYQYPADCVKARFLPWNTNPVSASPPLMSGLNQPPLNSVRLIPAPFLVALDYTYPVGGTACALTWDDIPDWASTPGEGPEQRTVIYTNVPPQPQGTDPTIYPSLIYTALVLYPSQWDALFEEAMVNYLAQKLAISLVPDKKFAVTVRNQAIAVAKEMIAEARVISGNEAGYPQTTNSNPDWMRARNWGSGWYSGGYGIGAWGPYGSGIGSWGDWDSIAFSNGSIF